MFEKGYCFTVIPAAMANAHNARNLRSTGEKSMNLKHYAVCGWMIE
jgi:hypothetical protein